MKKNKSTASHRFHIVLAAMLLAGLSACGGGGGGGDDNDNTGVDTIAGDFLCTGHTATTVNVIGNNTYEFIADAGNCFGAQADQDLVKQAVDVVPEQTNVNPQTDSIVALSATAKLTSNRVPASSGGYLFLYLAVEMTNTSLTDDVCVEIGGAELEQANDDDMTEIELELLGDMFYGKAPSYRFHSECIPPGQTRIAWGRETKPSTFRPGDDLDDLDHIRVLFTVRIPDGINEYYLPAFTPNEAVWTSNKQTGGGNEFFFYEITNDFVNNSTDDLVFDRRSVDIHFFDENDYMVYSSSSTIDDYLGIDDSDLVDQDYIATAMGGNIGVQDHGGPIVPNLDAYTWVNGRASKIVIGLDVCDNVAPFLC